MDELDFDPSNDGMRWVTYFDRLGFGEYTKNNALDDVFWALVDMFLELARESNLFSEYAKLVWFSDTILFYSKDDSLKSYYAICDASRLFFDECLKVGVPVRGAMSFGEFYADNEHSLFFGRALVDACKYGEKFNWLGFVLHETALKKRSELGVADNLSCYREWNAEVKDREPNTFSQESVIAYLPGPGSIQFAKEKNPYRHYLKDLEKILFSAECEKHKRKYQNTIHFIQHYAASDGTPIVPSSLR